MKEIKEKLNSVALRIVAAVIGSLVTAGIGGFVMFMMTTGADRNQIENNKINAEHNRQAIIELQRTLFNYNPRWLKLKPKESKK